MAEFDHGEIGQDKGSLSEFLRDRVVSRLETGIRLRLLWFCGWNAILGSHWGENKGINNINK